MSNTSPAVFHCPSCGALAKVDAGADGVSVCTECGHEFRRPIRVAPRHAGPRAEGLGKFVQRDVVSRRRLVERDHSVILAELPPPLDADKIVPDHGDQPDDEVISDDGHKKVVRRRKRKRKVNRRPYVYTLLWLTAVVFGFFHLKSKFNRQLPSSSSSHLADTSEEKAKSAELKAYLQEHFGECQQVLGNYIKAVDAPGRAQFVYDPLRVTPLMDRFASDRAVLRPSGKLTTVKRGVIVRDSYRAIESLWNSDVDEDFEVTFIREDGAWRIDWEALVGFSTTPWQFFRNGIGPDKGEFRLFMREVQLSNQGGDQIGVKFYAPVFEATLRHRSESDTILVPAASPLGNRIRALIAQQDEKPGWGDPTMQQRDPKGLSRVRVVLQWRESDKGKKHLYIEELKAGNWLADGLDEEFASEEDEG